MYQNLTKTLTIFGGGAAPFYAIGFTVVKTYTYKAGLGGMFWFTKEFYIDAGVLMLLLPSENNLLLFEDDESSLKSEEISNRINLLIVNFFIVFLLILATFLYANNYDKLFGNPFFIKLIGLITLNL